MKYVGVARDDRKVFSPALGIDDPGDIRTVGDNLGDLGVKMNFATKFFE